MSSLTLFSPVKIGKYFLKNRIMMAAMTRNRSLVPDAVMATYYAQRSEAGLIVSEGTLIEEQGTQWPNAPGIYNEKQIHGWKKVNDAVHKAGGRIFCQLWHVGRLTHPLMPLSHGKQPIGPSAISAEGGQLHTPEGVKGYVTPRELTTEEVENYVKLYAKAAENALAADFDGVEIHGAFGYLPNQFLHDGSNKRTDKYGGSIENRSRFVLEVVDAVSRVAGNDRVGIKLSPSNTFNSMSDSNRLALYTHLAEQLSQRGLAYVTVMEAGEMDIKNGGANYKPIPATYFKEILSKGGVPLVVNNGFNKEKATKVIESGQADAVSFGHDFIANPDLVSRLRHDKPLAQVQWQYAYAYPDEASKHVGYTDYPTATD